MRCSVECLDGLAACLDYPRSGTESVARDAAARLPVDGDGVSAARDALVGLADWLRDAAEGEPEERYTQLFDLKPVCTLHAGYHLLGDTYDRGALLAGLATDLKQHGVPYTHDLPDFMPTLLRLLGRFDDVEDRRLLVHAILIPALEKMQAALEKSEGPWPKLVLALRPLLDEEVPKGDEVIPVPSARHGLEVLQCST